MWSCNYDKTPQFQKELEEYRHPEGDIEKWLLI
jgi:hypothetical protein